ELRPRDRDRRDPAALDLLDRARHRARLLATRDAARARRGAVAALARLRPGRRDARPDDAAHHPAPDPAEHDRADHRDGLADDRDLDPARLLALLPRSR